jgi:hypothetical protein
VKIKVNNPAFRLVPPLYNTVELVEDFVMEHPLGVRTVPAGFICDLESVPQCFQWLFPKLGRGALAGIAHDDLYRSRLVSRAEADAIYLAILKEHGAGRLERWTKYLTLRLVGWVAWNANARQANQ